MSATLDPNDTIAAVASSARPGLARYRPAFGSRGDQGRARRTFFLTGTSRCRRGRPTARLGRLKVAGLRPLLPVMIALWPAPRTYTGQPVAEIHMTGSTPLVSLVLAHCLARVRGLLSPVNSRSARFSRAGIDLTRAEAVHGVIERRSSAQLEAALAAARRWPVRADPRLARPPARPGRPPGSLP